MRNNVMRRDEQHAVTTQTTKTAKSEMTRETIICAALKLFQEKGCDKTTIRDIAKEANVALGAAYYYFRSKDELVLHFYSLTQEQAKLKNLEIVDSGKDFQERLTKIIEFKFEQMKPYRKFISVIARNAAEPDNPLSPFSERTRAIREDAILLIRQAIEGSNLKYAAALHPYMPRLLWFYQMGMIFFWIHDNSAGQVRSRNLLEHSMKILVRLFRLSTVPFLRPVNQSVIRLLDIVDGR